MIVKLKQSIVVKGFNKKELTIKCSENKFKEKVIEWLKQN